jgi:hypothetical protein
MDWIESNTKPGQTTPITFPLVFGWLSFGSQGAVDSSGVTGKPEAIHRDDKRAYRTFDGAQVTCPINRLIAQLTRSPFPDIFSDLRADRPTSAVCSFYGQVKIPGYRATFG